MGHSEDRQVHAEIPGVVQLVRYERAGRWYVERPDQPRRSVSRVSVAAAVAALIQQRGGILHDRPGGQMLRAAMMAGPSGLSRATAAALLT